VIATPLLFSMDIQTTYTLQSNTEITFARLICMQAFEQGYGVPCHSYGTGTDSMLLDGQNMIERTSLIHMMAMSDASVLGGAGQLETAKTISPLQLIIDDEIFAIARRLRHGLAITDEEMDFEELLAGDDESGYLMSEHTLNHYQEMHRPELFYRGNRSSIEEEKVTLTERAEKRYYEIMEKPVYSALSSETEQAVHAIVKKAAKELSNQ
jgi:trimethylamine:corrinoid methyltransferase-like protein